MIVIENGEIFSDTGKKIRPLGSGTAFTRCAALEGDTPGMFEETDGDFSGDTAGAEAAYRAEVERLLRRRYSLSDELALLRQREANEEEFNEYYRYAELCKAQARENTRDDG